MLYDLICEEILCFLIYFKMIIELKLMVKNVLCFFFWRKNLCYFILRLKKVYGLKMFYVL